MPSFSTILIPGAKVVRAYGERLAKGITQEIAARKPRTGATVIDTNHASFIYGHLSLYPTRTARFLGLDTSKLVLPENFQKLFSFEAKCEDDPDGTIYPALEKITEVFFKDTDTMLTALEQVPDDAHLKPNTEERSRERFPNAGSFVVYLMSTHANGHFGQLSTWRRCMGLPPA